MNNKILDKLFFSPATNTWLQLFRYGFVGGVAFVVDYGSLYLLTEYVGFHHLVSAALAFILGLCTNYLLSISWVFNQNRRVAALKEFIVFLIIGIIGLGLNELIMFLATDVAGIHYLISKLISTALVFLWNFFVRKFTLF